MGLSRSRSNLGGVSLLGPKALRCVGGISLRREFMLPLADSSENCLLETCAVLHGSETIEALCKWRLENVYSSGAWITFWNQHSVINAEPKDICGSISESDLVAVIDRSISRQAYPPDFHNTVPFSVPFLNSPDLLSERVVYAGVMRLRRHSRCWM